VERSDLPYSLNFCLSTLVKNFITFTIASTSVVTEALSNYREIQDFEESVSIFTVNGHKKRFFECNMSRSYDCIGETQSELMYMDGIFNPYFLSVFCKYSSTVVNLFSQFSLH